MSPPSTSSTMALNTTLSVLAIAVMLQHIIKEMNMSTEEITRGETISQQLGPWSWAGKKTSFFWSQASSPILGPQLMARLADKFSGLNEVHLSRIPQGETGSRGWAVLLAIIHPNALLIDPMEITKEKSITNRGMSRSSWSNIPLAPLVNHDSQLCIKMSRATLMTLFALTNARPIYRYSSAAGYRSAYPSYCGQWTISWPIGKPCVVRLAPHDSHNAAADVYPPSFPARVDKCVEMMSGIITDGQEGGWKVAFPGRAKHAGPWILQERKKGFGGAHGTRHLWNMQGGKVYEVDLLAMVPWTSNQPPENTLSLEIPIVAGVGGEEKKAVVYVLKNEEEILARALDCLPWSQLSWSLHRGMRDLLLAFGKPIMEKFRTALAATIHAGVAPHRKWLIAHGWAGEFIDAGMASMASTAILAGSGNSGDVVRVVVAIAECLISSTGDKVDFDRTEYWSLISEMEQYGTATLDAGEDGVEAGVLDLSTIAHREILVALTKFFVLEWSQELDYQLYHEVPVELLFA